MTISFGHYLQHVARLSKRTPQSARRNDFIVDARSDPGLADLKSWRALETYLWSQHACRGAVEGGYVVWRAYRRWRMKPSAS